MDRDAPAIVPPIAWTTARNVGLTGLTCTVAAAIVGFATESTPGVLSTIRLVLVAFGSIAAGASVALRSDLWKIWGLAAIASLAAVPGTPAHWESFRLLFRVLTGVAVVGMILVSLPRVWQLGMISAMILFHFVGIFMAAASPPTNGNQCPWIVEQSFQRVYNSYLQFIYLRNPYHFYSPEPGPASLLAFLLETDTGEVEGGRTKYQYQWVVVPRRPADVKDPLGLTYYRRLSLTEQAARSYPGLSTGSERFEKEEALNRRRMARVESLPGEPVINRYLLSNDSAHSPRATYRIPLDALPSDPAAAQYRIPQADAVRFVIPSYAQHVIMDFANDEKTLAKTKVKVYRLEHRTPFVRTFLGNSHAQDKPGDPYHPTTYRPYFLGEYDVYGKLLDPREPMLYWLLPIVPLPSGSTVDPKAKDYQDFLSLHAGYPFDWSLLR